MTVSDLCLSSHVQSSSTSAGNNQLLGQKRNFSGHIFCRRRKAKAMLTLSQMYPMPGNRFTQASLGIRGTFSAAAG
eukprot:Skav207831  [mRNA]  locus=scaffold3131:171989:179871:+ [translate_table: standard]